MTLRIFFIIAATVWTVVILVGCLIPIDELPDSVFSVSDKAMHAGLFVGFSCLWLLAGQSIVRVVILGILYGLLIEALQAILPIHRIGDWRDAAADTIGVLLGTGAVVISRKRRR